MRLSGSRSSFSAMGRKQKIGVLRSGSRKIFFLKTVVITSNFFPLPS